MQCVGAAYNFAVSRVIRNDSDVCLNATPAATLLPSTPHVREVKCINMSVIFLRYLETRYADCTEFCADNGACKCLVSDVSTRDRALRSPRFYQTLTYEIVTRNLR